MQIRCLLVFFYFSQIYCEVSKNEVFSGAVNLAETVSRSFKENNFQLFEENIHKRSSHFFNNQGNDIIEVHFWACATTYTDLTEEIIQETSLPLTSPVVSKDDGNLSFFEMDMIGQIEIQYIYSINHSSSYKFYFALEGDRVKILYPPN